MGRGGQQAAVQDAATEQRSNVVARRAHLTPVDAGPNWTELAESDPHGFAVAVAQQFGPQLTEALKAATPADQPDGKRWFDDFDLIRISRPETFSWAPIVITLAAYRHQGADQDEGASELAHLYGAGYEIEVADLLDWVTTTEAGQVAELAPIEPFPSFDDFVEP